MQTRTPATPSNIDFQLSLLRTNPIHSKSVQGQKEVSDLVQKHSLFSTLLSHCNCDPVGLEVSHRIRDRYCRIGASTTGDSFFVQYFSANGVIETTICDSPLAALEEVVLKGYSAPVKGIYGQLSKSPTWLASIGKSEVLAAYKHREISLIELVNKFNEIDNSENEK